MPDTQIVIEVFGEGVTDLGVFSDTPRKPDSGVVPILLYKLCEPAPTMRIKTKKYTFLQGKGLWQKALFAKRQVPYNKSAGVVFVLDTDGDHPAKLDQLKRGRDNGLSDFPMAVGVAHPCIEAWLLASTRAIRKSCRMHADPVVPEHPETLPASRVAPEHDPKAVLKRCVGAEHTLSSNETSSIARSINDVEAVRTRCPLSFAPFADEVTERIKPLFVATESGG